MVTNLTNPEEEWMCAFCEYNLFYGDEKAFKRALAQRKTILKRRRRAMERAAAAAAGRKILDEDELLQECKAQNARLIDYFQRVDVLQRLLGYVTGQIEGEDRGRFK